MTARYGTAGMGGEKGPRGSTDRGPCVDRPTKLEEVGMGALVEMVVPLSPEEQVALKCYREIVLAGKASIGAALVGIRDGRLYRGTHPTFEAFCKDEFKMPRRHVDRKIAAVQVNSLRPIGSQPTSEGAVRPLTTIRDDEGNLDLEGIAEAYQEAVETAPEGKVTGKHVQSVVDKRKGKKRIPNYKTEKHTHSVGTPHRPQSLILDTGRR